MTTHPYIYWRRAVTAEMASLGLTRRQIAAALRVPIYTVNSDVWRAHIDVKRDDAGWQPAKAKSRGRAETMAALYRAGYTLEQIGKQYGITRERVRQLMTKHLGIRQKDGGKAVKAERNSVVRRSKRAAKFMKKYGCSEAEWRELQRIGTDMLAAGRGLYQTPLRAWSNQRNNSIRRGIGWELNVWQWWTIWQQSGHWEQRGRGQGYVMCRYGDVGPYAVGNVFIATAIENITTAKHKKSGLPTGVYRNPSGTYGAVRTFQRKQTFLGSFPTPELAHAAYLMAAPQPEQRAA